MCCGTTGGAGHAKTWRRRHGTDADAVGVERVLEAEAGSVVERMHSEAMAEDRAAQQTEMRRGVPVVLPAPLGPKSD